MLEIEFEEPLSEICDCCGNTTVKLTRFVYENDNAFAIYYIRFTKDHDDKEVLGLVSLGDWGTDEISENRTSFLFKLWFDNENWNVSILDGEESPWNSEILGKILQRQEALKHPWIKDVFHITDHIVEEDQELIKYFNSQG
ncbi:hypothetical protein LPB85_08320 [Chryseobacterium sp. LC2016-27]|uniref:hypothetical protein n=1 Tax=Chryseobacterium sp. LC2016-27 TaxID=2897326 RepID=UPI001E4808A6|nr:hypothetical protein [Chryseobacterium sp. LC2016-27]MCD0455453.1 hypothetical protein [Chryseobacterium sp. LC2016-27]